MIVFKKHMGECVIVFFFGECLWVRAILLVSPLCLSLRQGIIRDKSGDKIWYILIYNG